MEFYRAELPYYTCGFWVDDDRVIINAAPIMGWAIGRTLDSFVKWANSKGGQVDRIPTGVLIEYEDSDTNVVTGSVRGSKVGEPLPVCGKSSEVNYE